MRDFNYPTLADAEAEDIRILQLLEAESWGRVMDDKEEQEERNREMEIAQMRAEDGQ
jgi:hypothetical protein